MESQNTFEGAVQEIYPGGDIIFLCGPNKVKLLVHSIFVTNASRVFATMLGPFFLEGQPQTHSGPREIPLPEDDPFSMHAIFSVIHSRYEVCHEKMSPKQLLSIAYAADKYDLISTLKYASSYWFSSIRTPGQSPHVEMHLDNMKAAYLFENADAFQVATSSIVLGYTRPISHLSSHFDYIMPQETTLILEEKRNKIRLDIIQLLWLQEDTIEDQVGRDIPREWIVMMQRHGFSPKSIARSNLSETLTTIENACKPEVLQGSRISMTVKARLRIRTELEELRVSAGICLASLRNRT